MAYSKGLLLGFSLIIAIGAQNAFVLRQGLQRSHVLLICILCSVCDALLILAGTLGAGSFFVREKFLALCLGGAGVAFLAYYALLHLRSALRPQTGLRTEGGPRISRTQALRLTLGFTLLNPHVYLDTVVIFGGYSTRYPLLADRFSFALGGMTASLVWFLGLGYGAFLLAPVLSQPKTWQALDGAIAVLMLGLAVMLAVSLRNIYTPT